MMPATQLEHLQQPDVASIESLVGQHHHPVDMGAEDLQLFPGVAGQEYGRRPEDCGLGLLLLDETTQIELRRRQVIDDGRPIDDQQRGTALASHATNGGDDAVETLLHQRIEDIEVVHPLADKVGIEEAEAAQVSQHEVVGLGEESGDQRLAARGRMVKGELIAQRRLTDAG
jgi:hypothetical protein